MSHLNRTLALLCFLFFAGAIALFYTSCYSEGRLACPLSQGVRTWRPTSASDALLTSAGCSRDWQGHVRTVSRPLDFQWLALSEDSKDLSLLGPDGGPVPLQKIGPLTLLNNTAYRFEPQAAGSHTLLVSNERVSQFHWHPSDCYCPTDSFPRFLERYDCSAKMGVQVKKNMARWRPRYLTPEMIEFNGDPFLHTDSIFLQFAIIKNRLYCRRRDGQPNCSLPAEGSHFFARLNPVVRMIQAVLRRVEIPDLVFFWNKGDNPFMGHYTFQPLFSQSSTAWHGDQLLPTFQMAVDKFSGVDVILAATGKPWEERDDVAHFVGHLTGQPRDQARGSPLLNPRVRAAEIALERPDLFDINVVINDNIPVEDSVMKRLLERKVLKRGPRPDRNGLVKYVVDLPGNSAAWRLGSRFGDGAVTLKTQTPWNEFWHFMLEADRNVLLVGDWPEDLTERVEAARARDADMRCVARAAQLLSLTRMRQEDLLCWTALSFYHLATKFESPPLLTDDYVEIPVEHREASACDCGE